MTVRLVVLLLFSDASVQQKRSMARAMKRHDKEYFFKSTVQHNACDKSAVEQMPVITPSTQL